MLQALVETEKQLTLRSPYTLIFPFLGPRSSMDSSEAGSRHHPHGFLTRNELFTLSNQEWTGVCGSTSCGELWKFSSPPESSQMSLFQSIGLHFRVTLH